MEMVAIHNFVDDDFDNGLSIGDGIYEVDPEQLNDPFEVYCDMTTEGGGWTLAGRQVPSEQFTLTDQDINLRYWV